MILALFLIFVLATVLWVMTAKTRKDLQRPLIILFPVVAIPTLLLGAVVCGVPSADPNAPRDTVGAFFKSVQDMEFAEADRLLIGEDVFTTDNLSDETQAMVYSLSSCLKAEPVGSPVFNGFTAVQPVLITRGDFSAVIDSMDDRAYNYLASLIPDAQKSDLFMDDGTTYLPEIAEAAYQNAYAPVADPSAAQIITEQMNITLFWTPFGWYIRPDTALVTAVTGCPTTEAEPSLKALDSYVTEIRTQLLENLPLLHITYTLDRNITKGPVPDPDGFHTTTDPQEVVAVIAEARQLLDGQTVSWSPDIELLPDSVIRYYYDPSILVIVWQELRDDCVVTFTEVKIAHPTQLFRGFCGDAYQESTVESVWETPTAMAQRTNSVVAVTGDFYRRRIIGTVVYQGQLYRNDPNTIDTLLFTPEGDMVMFSRKFTNPHQMARYIKDRNIQFSVSFGPILIQDGKKVENKWYTIGEIHDRYDRCVFGQIDKLHYMIVNTNHTPEYKTACVLDQAADYLLEKGCVQGYTMDGGQTGSLVFNGELINYINYGGERTSSDMLCFVSAIPEEER